MESLKKSILSLWVNLKERTQKFRDGFIIEVKLLTARVYVRMREHLLSQLSQLPEQSGELPHEFCEALKQGINQDKTKISDWKSELELTKQKLKAHRRT